ncbi:hypothetical protein J7E61_15340 [Pseudomonas fluorescens]|uniref:Uncharacterized protein n=1 Tax=Pseudomonas fluorescens TaxID=294 RepID=A0A944DHQ3_PSEFL|nr:hypothetical protein [Pseudomonas fluorescens]MBT2309324.1 hypothetical protein [Pseudomonas fluorescens]MBT2313792.1 hypothetical protein [Pseudomonas fluorescens]MBT2318508.1 hypothetical protein [Pseudomonas fluorescens]MBT2329431.1 hypothetical protein [Pseudomonas fluorescens]
MDDRFIELKHPALLPGQVVRRLNLIDFHHPHRGRNIRKAADRAEMSLRGALNRQQRRFRLLALVPKHQLLACHKRDQQGHYSPQTLLNRQGRDSKLSGTLTIHPEIPPTPSGDLVEAP